MSYWPPPETIFIILRYRIPHKKNDDDNINAHPDVKEYIKRGEAFNPPFAILFYEHDSSLTKVIL
jgi:hypothetical protein